MYDIKPTWTYPVAGYTWLDSNGKERKGREPENRCSLRFALQSAGSDAEYYLYRNLLQKFDREWNSQSTIERSGV